MTLFAGVGHGGDITPVLTLSKMSTAPFHHGKACASEWFEFLRGHCNRFLKRFVGHKHAQHAVGGGRDDELGLVGVVFALKRD